MHIQSLWLLLTIRVMAPVFSYFIIAIQDKLYTSWFVIIFERAVVKAVIYFIDLVGCIEITVINVYNLRELHLHVQFTSIYSMKWKNMQEKGFCGMLIFNCFSNRQCIKVDHIPNNSHKVCPGFQIRYSGMDHQGKMGLFDKGFPMVHQDRRNKDPWLVKFPDILPTTSNIKLRSY